MDFQNIKNRKVLDDFFVFVDEEKKIDWEN